MTGGNQMRANIAREITRRRNAVERAAVQEMNIEAKESMRRTPVRFGALRASTRVLTPEWDGNTLTVIIAVGDTSTPYAIYVHENLDAFHKVGQAKFLESTLMESRPYMAARIARRLGQ